MRFNDKQLSGVGFNASRSPHQFWNALQQEDEYQQLDLVSRSPHQFWNALQRVVCQYLRAIGVAVPINFGMRFNKEVKGFGLNVRCRSPHQFWNALQRGSTSVRK